jgi:hypothetical protein
MKKPEDKFWKIINSLNWRIVRLENHVRALEESIVDLKVRQSELRRDV